MLFFFFQAEDGIRYLVRSRGLGDVYKRQAFALAGDLALQYFVTEKKFSAALVINNIGGTLKPVSYTHLTLPTSDLV